MSEEKINYLEQVASVNQNNLEELQILKNELNNKLSSINRQQLYDRIHRTLKVDNSSIKRKKDGKKQIREIVVAMEKVDKMIINHRNTVLIGKKNNKNKTTPTMIKKGKS